MIDVRDYFWPMIPDKIYGLLLAGGYSRRMKTDKAFLKYDGEFQYIRMLKLLRQVCEKTFISCREDQVKQFNKNNNADGCVTDQLKGVGPAAALLAAHDYYPGPWLVLACDLPLVDLDALEYLVQLRESDKIATAYQIAGNSFPEPLVTIWEPAGLAILKEKVQQQPVRLIDVLNNHPCRSLLPPFPEKLTNANTPVDDKWVRNQMKP